MKNGAPQTVSGKNLAGPERDDDTHLAHVINFQIFRVLHCRSAWCTCKRMIRVHTHFSRRFQPTAASGFLTKGAATLSLPTMTSVPLQGTNIYWCLGFFILSLLECSATIWWFGRILIQYRTVQFQSLDTCNVHHSSWIAGNFSVVETHKKVYRLPPTPFYMSRHESFCASEAPFGDRRGCCIPFLISLAHSSPSRIPVPRKCCVCMCTTRTRVWQIPLWSAFRCLCVCCMFGWFTNSNLNWLCFHSIQTLLRCVCFIRGCMFSGR